jgi:hypothetical protein
VTKFKWTVSEWKFIKYIETFAQFHWIDDDGTQREFDDNKKAILENFNVFEELKTLGLQGNIKSFQNSISWVPNSYLSGSKIWDKFNVEVLKPAELMFKVGFCLGRAAPIYLYLLTSEGLPKDIQSIIIHLIATTEHKIAYLPSASNPDNTEVIVSESAAMDFGKLLKYTAIAGLISAAAAYVFSSR